MSTIVPDDAFLQHEIEQLAVKAGRIILKAEESSDRSGYIAADHSADPAAHAKAGPSPVVDQSFVNNIGSSVLNSSSGFTVNLKSGRRDLVTSKDIEIQQMLMKHLQIFVDEPRFLCEEELPLNGNDEAGWSTQDDLQDRNVRDDQKDRSTRDDLQGRSTRDDLQDRSARQTRSLLIREPEEVNEGVCFIIDPIDGTANFVHGHRHSCTSIAMAINGEVRLGVIYDPYCQELFSACKGGGAWLNGHRLPELYAPIADTITVFGTAPYDDATNEQTFRMAHLLYELSADVRRTGSAALDLCWTACGRFGLYAELGLSPWDFAAGKLIAEETGCVVTNIDGQPLHLHGKNSILCGRPTAVKEFRSAMNVL